MKSVFVLSFIALLLCCGSANATELPLQSSKDATYVKVFFKKTWSTTITINLGSCQASGTLTITTNESTGQVHAWYSMATNCGGGIHGTGGQFFRTGKGDGPLEVDPASITYEYDSEEIQANFEKNGGKPQLEAAMNDAVKFE